MPLNYVAVGLDFRLVTLDSVLHCILFITTALKAGYPVLRMELALTFMHMHFRVHTPRVLEFQIRRLQRKEWF